MAYQQGDIVMVDFNPTVGREPQNMRPALVVSNDDYNTSTSMTIVCLITSKDNRFYLHEPLPDGISISGVVVMEQLRALDLEARDAKTVDHLNAAELDAILVCLRSFF